MLHKFLSATMLATSLVVAGGAFMTPAFAEVVYNRGNDADPETLDPHKTSTVAEANIIRDLFEGLVAQDAKADLIPGAAESWTVSDDGTVYTFKLRQGATWSDGTPVTAEDFVYSFRRLLDPATAAQYASMLYVVKNGEALNTGKAKPEDIGVKAIDASTLRGHAQCADAVFPRNADPSGDLPGQQGLRGETRRRMGEAGQHGIERRLYAR